MPSTHIVPTVSALEWAMDVSPWTLLALLLPLWLAAGLADYACHARTDLAHTSGVAESAMHLMQTAQIGLPVLGLLFFAHTPLLLALVLLGVVAHTITAFVDVRYTTPRRRIASFEHLVHALLVALPWIAFALLMASEWPRIRTMLSAPDVAEDWALRWAPAFTGNTIVIVLAASVVFGVVPGLMEFIHAWRVRARDRNAHRVESSASS